LGSGPTRAYYDAYCAANEALDALAKRCARWLEDAGFAAWAQARDNVAGHDTLGDHVTRLPHKTVATLAGMGWIGRDALLVNQRFGSAVRITSVVTDAPLPCDAPVSVSHCGSCDECARICPAAAIHGPAWQAGVTTTGDLVDVERCSSVAAQLSRNNFGIDCSICGLCLFACPFTQKWLRRETRGRHAGVSAAR
jgi:epoxyqueuosine reductase QueG